jgi:hypothetical protein
MDFKTCQYTAFGDFFKPILKHLLRSLLTNYPLILVNNLRNLTLIL